MIPGRGVAAKVEGYHVLAGNRAMLNENNITFPQQMTTQAEEFINRGCTMIYHDLHIFGQPFHWLCCIV